MALFRIGDSATGIRVRFIIPFLVLLGGLLLIVTYLGIRKSRTDSLELIRQQGAALIESLTLSSDNAIKANSLFDLLVQEKFSDLSSFLKSRPALNYSSSELADYASQYGVDAILIYDNQAKLKVSGTRGLFIDLNELEKDMAVEVGNLLADSANKSSFQTIVGESPGSISIYFLEKSPDQRYIVGIVSDALFYSSAKKDIGIGYLVQNMAREVGIEYIVFQTIDGIVFSSRDIGPLLKIEKDSFLTLAFESDTTLSRIYRFNDRGVLELVKTFSSTEYGQGLFRLGISLDKYYNIMAGFDRQMIALSGVIFAAIILVILYLIGKQKRFYLDRSLKRMKSLSEKVFDSINSGLIVVNKEAIVEMANRQALVIFDIGEDEIIGKGWEHFPFKDLIPFEGILSGRQSQGEIESSFDTPLGKKVLLANISRLYDEQGQMTGAVAVIFDYTRIKELEESARRKERLTELGDLAAGVAHEIRNPLNGISIAAQRLMAEFEPQNNAEEFRFFAGQVKSEAGRLNEIVSRFLAMAKGKTEGHGQINASKIIASTLELLRLSAEEKDILIKSEIEPEILLNGAEDRLKQMIINLVKNGIEACGSQGGTIRVRLYREGVRSILSISDTGQGIPEEIKKKIFTPYFTTKEYGTGLGLSIVYQIVEEFGGQIGVLSPPKGGTEFRIIFTKQG